jgi:hypothetical protein
MLLSMPSHVVCATSATTAGVRVPQAPAIAGVAPRRRLKSLKLRVQNNRCRHDSGVDPRSSTTRTHRPSGAGARERRRRRPAPHGSARFIGVWCGTSQNEGSRNSALTANLRKPARLQSFTVARRCPRDPNSIDAPRSQRSDSPRFGQACSPPRSFAEGNGRDSTSRRDGDFPRTLKSSKDAGLETRNSARLSRQKPDERAVRRSRRGTEKTCLLFGSTTKKAAS